MHTNKEDISTVLRHKTSVYDYMDLQSYKDYINFVDFDGTYDHFLLLLNDHEKEQPTITVVHDNDPDGWTAKEIFMAMMAHLNNPNVVTHAVSHGAPFVSFVNSLPVAESDVLVVLDHACPAWVQERFQERFKIMLIVDHHPETVNLNYSNDVVVIKDTRWSTAMLTEGFRVRWMEEHGFVESRISSLLPVMVNHYDTWQFGKPMMEDFDQCVKAFIALAFYEGMDQIDWSNLLNSLKAEGTNVDMMVGYVERGLQLQRYQDKAASNIVSRYMAKMETVWFAAPKCENLSFPDLDRPIRFGMVFHSDMMDTLADKILDDASMDFAVIVYAKHHEKSYKVSFRSRDDRLGVAEIARFYGGGGHRNSAGAQMSVIDFSYFLSSATVAS